MANKIMGEPHINKIIGMTEVEAIKHLAEVDKTLRVVNRNGASVMIRGIDIDMNRVNVFVYNGEIVDIDKLG